MTENLSWYENVPKVELHLHLTGAIPLDTLWEIIKKYGGDPSVPNLKALQERFRYRDFPHFLETWRWKNGFLREYEDFTFLAESVARDLAAQHVIYAEVSFSLQRFKDNSLETGKLAEAIRSGIGKVPEIEINLMVDLVRDYGPETAFRNLDEVSESRTSGITGITIGGAEQLFPPGPFADVYEKARHLGFRTSVHAGEGAGPESIRNALYFLKPDRIGHGTRAIEDRELVDRLAEEKIPIEICLLSNLKTRVVASVEEHPVRHYFKKGIPLSINTDDPKMFGNSLAEEYRALETNLGFSRDEIRFLILQGVDMSWLSDERKQDMKARLTGHPDWSG